VLGHRRLTTTAAYVSVNQEELRRVVEILERDRWGFDRKPRLLA
jgi:hypothetical protein